MSDQSQRTSDLKRVIDYDFVFPYSPCRLDQDHKVVCLRPFLTTVPSLPRCSRIDCHIVGKRGEQTSAMNISSGTKTSIHSESAIETAYRKFSHDLAQFAKRIRPLIKTKIGNDQDANDLSPDSKRRGKELPIVINGTTIAAAYDTMAEGNIMSKSRATELGLEILPVITGQGTFSLANGKKVSSIGLVETWCTFALDPKVKVKTKFWVWDKFVVGSGMTMGRAFLKTTKTLSSFSHRLRARTSSWTMPFLNEISSDTAMPSERLLCMIDGQPMYVSPDTGSDLDVLSLRHVREKGYTIDTSVRKKVALGDGSIIVTAGQVNDVHIVLGGHSFYKTFDVLSGIKSDVILGETTLEDLEAYTEYEDQFSDIDLGYREYDMSAIVDLGRFGEWWTEWRERRTSKGVENLTNRATQHNRTTGEQVSLSRKIETMDMHELCRQDEADQVNLALSRNDPVLAARAQQDELKKREKYNRDKERLLKDIPSAAPPGTTKA